MARRPPTETGPIQQNRLYDENLNNQNVGSAQNNNNNNNNNNNQNIKEKLPIPNKHNSKVLCSSPPAVLKDKKATVSFTKGNILGEGGFARCYEVWDGAGKRFAAKVIAKASLKSPKSKQKLFTEIKIHQNMRHHHIVQFQHVFEDSQNVYIILELCESKTFVELMKKKKRLQESEAAFYALQLLDAISYMHKKNVIHRDLKLGNLFLNSHWDIKIGDFGLATVVANDDERKKTICGTPNYIAPEILFDRKNGHSFEVDLWSFGVIIYTMLVGRPPFQTKDVQEIYRRIRDNEYEFPQTVDLSPQVKDLIRSLLCPAPELRPKIEDVLNHPWLKLYRTIPKELSPSAALTPPKHLFPAASTNVGGSVPKKEFKPILMESRPTNAVMKENVMQPSSASVAQQQQKQKLLNPYPTPDKKVLKPVSTNANSTPVLSAPKKESTSSVSKPLAAVMSKLSIGGSTNKTPQLGKTVAEKEQLLLANQVQVSPILPNPTSRRSMLEKIYQNLKTGLSQMKINAISDVLFKVTLDAVQNPKIFISKWIDYSNKYGLGYQLTNGSVGVYFNDSTTMIMSANESNFEYLEYAKGTERTVMNRQAHLISKYPTTLEKKVTLIKYFKNYMQDNLSKASQFCFSDKKSVSNLDFLVKYMRTKHAVLFRLTNQIVQINFFDHTKLIVSLNGLVITFIDRDKKMTTYALLDILKGNVEKNDIVSRLKYTRDILESLVVQQKK